MATNGVAERNSLESSEPTKHLNRLQVMAQLDRTRALYGDSLPPPREAGPYPEGQILYNCHSRYVVRHGDLVTKYTTSSHGLGANEIPNKALALQFIKDHMTIPVPAVISSRWYRIPMEYVVGQTLKQAWPVLTLAERLNIVAELTGYIVQLRALPGIYIGRLNGEGAIVPSVMTRSGGPFHTIAQFQDFFVHPPRRLAAQSMYWHQITTQLGSDYPIVFTNGDIAARNVMVRDGHIVAILDWEMSGWYPDYWEYVFAIRGMDRVDWETLGQHVPSLFPQRHDLEYILVQFILTLS